LDPAELNLAVDLTRLLVRATGQQIGEAGRHVVDQTLAARSRLSGVARKTLLDLALAPRFRTAIEPAELRAFEAFFGREAADKLRGEQTEELGLEGFSIRYGPEASLLLLDALFRVATADGKMEDVQARRLERSASDLGVDDLVVTALFQRYDPAHAAGDHSWAISGTRMTVGRAPGNDVVIPDPQVAKHHCSFLFVGGRWRVEARSGRPVLVDGELITSAPVLESSRIGIGPWTLQLTGGRIKAYGHRSFQPLCVRNLQLKIGEITLLDGVSFTVFTGEVIALVGPSGSGKTTLINAISGIRRADHGEVLLGGRSFHTQLAADPSGVGFVPQEDLVHPELTVEESLYYSGCLRFSPDVAKADIQKEVDRVLGELDIRGIRGNRIGDTLKRGISGGQRKRVNLGQEMLTRSTRVLFLDEPTSGLDPRSSHGIAKKVRVAADGGRIVFLVTHDLSAGLLQQVDHLLVIVEGGRMAYFGKPEDACRYFKVATPDLIFERLSDRSPGEWAVLYRDSKDYRRFVQSREHLLGLNTHADGAEPDEDQDEKTSILPSKRPNSLHQLRTLSARYFRTKMRDRVGLSVILAQPPLLALMMWIVFPAPTVPALFMLSLSWIWFGLSASVRELIIDRAIWKRERRVGVGVTAYVGSKVLVLGGMVALQCVVFTAMTWAALGFGEPSRVAVQEVAQSGVVESVAVAQGDWVEKGDLLAKVGSLPLEQAVSEAKAEVERVEANVDLLAVEREGLLLKARDSLKTAESKLQRSSMVAKNTGRVSGVLVKPGESLVLGQAAVEVETDFYAYNLLKLMFISVLTGLAGFSLALMISAIFSSGVAAVSTLPLLIIPQICFSAILVPLKGMGVVAKAITWVTIERYAFEATLKAGSRVDEWVVHEFNTKPSGGALFDLGFKTADVNNMGLAYSTSMMALAAFSAIFLSIAWCVIWRRDRP
jgi:ABC-type multidrug transport system ATPase subunit/biotin carboxyl carrier protein